jgi:hypothetical protein
MQRVISTRKSVISTRRVLFLHAESDFFTQSVISTRSVISIDRNVISTFQHAKDWFLYAEYDFTRGVWFPHTRVIWHVCVWIWLSRVWFIHEVWFIREVWFLHAGCNFHTQCDFDTHTCDHDALDCDFNRHKGDFYTQSGILHVWAGADWLPKFWWDFFQSAPKKKKKSLNKNFKGLLPPSKQKISSN